VARRKTTRLAFDALMVEGALIAPDTIVDVAAVKAGNQSEADYRIPPGLKLRDEIGRSWRIAEALWVRFSQARTGGSVFAATQGFVDDLLRQVFGFASLETVSARRSGGRIFPVRRVALGGRVPIAVAAAGEGLDRGLDQFAEDHRKRSASLLIQELLNADEAARWGVATDGLKLRLLRDNASLTRPAYIEADLERMFGNGLYADFVALWLLIHESRFGAADAAPSDCPLERWRDAGREAGAKARDRLGVGVEAALKELGAGFIEHPANALLREAIEGGVLTPQALYEELLRLVYRLIFLFTTEDRGLLHDPKAGEAAKALYADGYSLARLRTQAARRAARDANYDLYEGLKVVFRALWRGEEVLGLPALGGLFRGAALPNLGDGKISNKRLLDAVFYLAWITEDHTLMRVNWRDMETEELGSVYEALLELTPRVGLEARSFFFAEGAETKGNARKTSGSYYTPDSLVQLLLDSALDPVIERTVNENPSRAVEALLELTVIDPACGSGHFLLAAGRRLATRVAQLRSPGAPSTEDWRHALREVVRRCLFGVDRNPLAVELCQTALWIESVDPGKPLTFLDAHIQCGNSLIGVWDVTVVSEGIPDVAYRPLTGDDKAVASAVRKANKTQRERPAQRNLFASGAPDISSQARALERLPEDDLREVEAKARAFEALKEGASWWNSKVACDLYLAAFFRPKIKRQGALEVSNQADDVPSTSDVWAALAGHPPQGRLTASAIDMAESIPALHWPLAFPQILAKGGFDCVVGNPPWERIKLQEEEFFSGYPLVAAAKNKAERGQRIEWLAQGMLGRHLYPELDHTAEQSEAEQRLYAQFLGARRVAEAASVFVRLDAGDGGRYPLTGVGDVNTYALFAETISQIRAKSGRAGFIVPTGIATDDTTKEFFESVVSEQQLTSLFSFYEIRNWFPGTDDRKPFCLLTLGYSPTARFIFDVKSLEDLHNTEKVYELSVEEFSQLNPNTLTLPTFRSLKDAELTKKIYARVPVLVREARNGQPEINSWGIRFMTMFHMSNDSHQFVDHGSRDRLPLYEAKMMHQFDHRWATYSVEKGEDTAGDVRLDDKQDPAFTVRPRYWVEAREVSLRTAKLPKVLLQALRERNAPVITLAMIQLIFGNWLLAHGTTSGEVASETLFPAWREFGERHQLVRGTIAPTQLGLCGNNPACLKPLGSNYLPAEPIDEIKRDERRSTAWYEADVTAVSALLDTAVQFSVVIPPVMNLETEADVIAYAEQCLDQATPGWFMGFRDICRGTDERTVIASVLPRAAIGHTAPLFSVTSGALRCAALLANLDSLVLDFSARQKVGGTHLTYSYLKQFPVLAPEAYTDADLEFIVPRVLELTYTAHDLTPWAIDLGYDGPPFAFDPERRARLRAELDARYARLYGLARDDLCYVLDPASVMGGDYPSETFRVLKANEEKESGYYRTQHLILAAWDTLEAI
jgi:hypothetical protein